MYIESIGLVSGRSPEMDNSSVADVAGRAERIATGTAIMSAQPDIVGGAVVLTAGPGPPTCRNPRKQRCFGRSAALVAPIELRRTVVAHPIHEAALTGR